TLARAWAPASKGGRLFTWEVGRFGSVTSFGPSSPCAGGGPSIAEVRMSNHRSLIVAAVILMVGACGGATTGPARGSGLYRLASVDGAPVPVHFPPSTGLEPVLSGDLYLRADGTFGLGLQCTLCGLLEGAWRLDGSTLHLTGHGGADIAAELE